MTSVLSAWLGLETPAAQLSVVQMSLRAFVVFFTALGAVRIGHRRFLAQLSPFDAVVGFILASTLSRAVNGSAAFFPTLGCGLVIVLLHRGLAALALAIPAIGDLVKGRPDIVASRGMFLPHRLRAHAISEADVLEEMRLTANTDDLAAVECATLERNGQVSVVLKDRARDQRAGSTPR